MKPNGRKLVVLFAVCAVLLLSKPGAATTIRGTFKLPVTARWGGMVLAPGEYVFTLDTESAGHIVTVRAKYSGAGGIILSRGLDVVPTRSESSIRLGHSEGITYVRALYLGDLGIALQFGAPRAHRLAELERTVTWASLSQLTGVK